MGSIIGMIIVGAIIGALARLFMKGEQNIGTVWTVILGAVGYGLGGWITGAILGSGHGVIQWIVGIIIAVILISIYLSVTNKKNS